MKEDVPRAYIKPKYKSGTLPNGNPFNVATTVLMNKNTKEYRTITRMVNDFLARSGKAAPISKIAY